MSKPGFSGNPIQRLQSFVTAAVKTSSARPQPNSNTPGGTAEPSRKKRGDPVPRVARQDKPHTSKETAAEEKPSTYAEVAKKARNMAPPATLSPSHWKGIVVPANEFVAKVSNAPAGWHYITGVVGAIPEGFDGIMLPERATATVVILPSTDEFP